ncbi:hypothetical protein VC116063_002075 [Vibrio cholerae O1 str. 116063]|nr:hypothetical protein VC116063_002075 [Vibrio cholerae O1 str. 116063]
MQAILHITLQIAANLTYQVQPLAYFGDCDRSFRFIPIT